MWRYRLGTILIRSGRWLGSDKAQVARSVVAAPIVYLVLLTLNLPWAPARFIRSPVGIAVCALACLVSGGHSYWEGRRPRRRGPAG